MPTLSAWQRITYRDRVTLYRPTQARDALGKPLGRGYEKVAEALPCHLEIAAFTNLADDVTGRQLTDNIFTQDQFHLPLSLGVELVDGMIAKLTQHGNPDYVGRYWRLRAAAQAFGLLPRQTVKASLEEGRPDGLPEGE